MEENKNIEGANEASSMANNEFPLQEDAGNLQPSTLNLETLTSTTMEVHHHPEVEKKGFKEYLLEGLMIFVAVTMGFFAEGLRETITDHSKEKEFIQSMIEDAKTDTANIRIAIALNAKRESKLDSLSELCFNYDAAENSDSAIYHLFLYGLIHPDFVSPTERTLLQLKNSGSMRLIRKKAAVDSIIQYDDQAKKLADQQAYYERYQNESINPGHELFNFQYFRFGSRSLRSSETKDGKIAISLLSHDKTKLIAFGNIISIYRGVVSFYIVRLEEMNDHAINLINSLQKEYHLENE